MNWPQDYPGVKHEDDSLSPTSAKTMFNLTDLTTLFRPQSIGVTLNAPLAEGDTIPVRRIRAYVTRKGLSLS